jgi:5-methylcytosine-specific restriction endonuclease McrA
MKCSIEGCDEEFDSSRALSVHESWCKDNRGDMRKDYNCEECGSPFESYESKDAGSGVNNKFCSRKCKDKSQESGGRFVDCNWCSSDVWKSPSQFGESSDGYSINNHFCDKSCEQSWKREHWRGEDHPSWSGGSPTHRGASWPEMRRKAIDRDGYKCKVCDMSREEHYNKYGQDLDVHHKIPVKEFEQVDDANYLINLVTTCRSCHGQLDTISRREANREPTISV